MHFLRASTVHQICLIFPFTFIGSRIFGNKETTAMDTHSETFCAEKGADQVRFAVPEVTDNWFGRWYRNPASFKNWTGEPGLFGLLRMKFGNDPDDSKLPKAGELDWTLPVLSPEFGANDSLSATWLGHATVLVRLDTATFITDPVWTRDVSPLTPLLPYRRYRPPPAKIDELPAIDFVLISHSHYDHFDVDAVKALAARFPEMRFFVPMGMGRQLTAGANVRRERITELSWGEHRDMEFRGESFRVWCLPAQHWSRRGAFDGNKSLWSGWAVIGQTHRFYFTGDTGFCADEFEKMGKKLGPFDLAAIPIGCYRPRWFMRGQHIDPHEAVAVHRLVGARHSIAVHWGTYEMGSFEHYLEPRALLETAARDAGLADGEFVALDHGETWTPSSGKKPPPAQA